MATQSTNTNSITYSAVNDTTLSQQYNTLDEPIRDTLMRDLSLIGNKMMHVLVPAGQPTNQLKNWDLWGMTM